MLKGKTVVLGVTGSIAAYKTASLASSLVKLGCSVHVIMTKNATNFINPITFETLTSHKCLVDTFDRNFEFNVEHVSLAKEADLFMIAPCSANVIGKIANGIADDMLTTTVMAAKCPVLISPAMNTNMFENQIVQDNIAKLKKYGYKIIDPASGYLACGDTGKGKMPEPELLLEFIVDTIAFEKDLAGKKVLVSAGPTREAIDPVRYITNHSTGTMGYALATNARRRGAEVTLVSGPTSIKKPDGVKVVDVISALDMKNAMVEEFDNADIVIMCAAVADFRPKDVADNKIKKASFGSDESEMTIPLESTDDILSTLMSRKNKQFVCGFSMETENMIDNSKEKLSKKNLDMICANNVKEEGAGFGTTTNAVTIITKDEVKEIPLADKSDVAKNIIDSIVSNFFFSQA